MLFNAHYAQNYADIIGTSLPGISKLKDYLNEVMDDNYIDSIQYKQWVSVDRSTLETITKSVDDFEDSFCDQIRLLIPHSFVAKQQSLFQTDAVSSLLPGQFLVIGGFPENYAFVLQEVPLEQLISNNTPICCILPRVRKVGTCQLCYYI